MSVKFLRTVECGVMRICDEGQNVYVDYRIDLLFETCQFSCSKDFYLSYKNLFDMHFGKYSYVFNVKF